MSNVSEVARLSLMIADFAIATPDGKITIVGGGVAGLGFDTHQGVTTRFTVIAQVEIPAALAPVEASIELLLERDGELVSLPGPAGDQPLRIGQTPTFEKPQLPGSMSLRDAIDTRHITVLDFGAGLPLAPNTAYTWVLQVDGDVERRTRYPFAVAAAPAAPVFG